MTLGRYAAGLHENLFKKEDGSCPSKMELAVDSHPVQKRRQDENMPDTVAVLFLQSKGDHAQHVEQSAHQDMPQQGPGMQVHLGQEQQAASCR